MKLLLVDAMNVIRRIYEAIPSEDSPEKAQACVTSSLSSMRRALDLHHASHVCVVFDHGAKNWRHELYDKYKANRKPMPEHLRNVLPTIKDELSKIGIRCFDIEGFEADDVIAALSQKWTSDNRGFVVILSTDKDFYSIMSDQIVIYDHFKSEWRDEAYVIDKFGVKPSQMADFLALTGDTSDNIPGVEKIGKKTAAELLRIHGNLDRIIGNSDKVSGQVGANLRKGIEMAKLSRQLVLFKTDMHLGLTWRMLDTRTTINKKSEIKL